eukprot:1014235-Pyramimonas_sp.AAC.1
MPTLMYLQPRALRRGAHHNTGGPPLEVSLNVVGMRHCLPLPAPGQQTCVSCGASLPTCLLRVYSLFPSVIGARCGYILSPLLRLVVGEEAGFESLLRSAMHATVRGTLEGVTIPSGEMEADECDFEVSLTATEGRTMLRSGWNFASAFLYAFSTSASVLPCSRMHHAILSIMGRYAA